MKNKLYKSEEALKNAFSQLESSVEESRFDDFKSLLDNQENATKPFWNKILSKLNFLILLLGIVVIGFGVYLFNTSDPGLNPSLSKIGSDQIEPSLEGKKDVSNLKPTNSDNKKIDQVNPINTTENTTPIKNRKLEESSIDAVEGKEKNVLDDISYASNDLIENEMPLKSTQLPPEIVINQRTSKNVSGAVKKVVSNSSNLNMDDSELNTREEESNDRLESKDRLDGLNNLNVLDLKPLDLAQLPFKKADLGLIKVGPPKEYYESHFYASTELGYYREENFAPENEYLITKNYDGPDLKLIVGYQFNKNLALEILYQPKDEDLKWGPKEYNFESSYGLTVNNLGLRFNNRFYLWKNKLSIHTMAGGMIGFGHDFENNSFDGMTFLDSEGFSEINYLTRWSRKNAKTYYLLHGGIGLEFEINRRFSFSLSNSRTFGLKKLSSVEVTFQVNEGELKRYEVHTKGGYTSWNMGITYRLRSK